MMQGRTIITYMLTLYCLPKSGVGDQGCEKSRGQMGNKEWTIYSHYKGILYTCFVLLFLHVPRVIICLKKGALIVTGPHVIEILASFDPVIS